MSAQGSSRIVSGRFPPPGTSEIADAIRARRGPRGITPLDAALLHAPPVAGGWNSLLGAIRSKGNLPGDVRELMILRIAALNRAAFEWVQHEPVGRTDGLTTPQLYVIRDTTSPLPPSNGILTSLQTAALLFAQASTKDVKVAKKMSDNLKRELEALVASQEGTSDDLKAKVEDLYVEAAATVATYNMVSRFLVSVDVAGMSDDDTPWPLDRKEHFVPITTAAGTHTIHAATITSAPDAPWLVFANSLITDFSMWEPLIPFLITTKDPISGKDQTAYNILLHSQRGHGKSTLPPGSNPTTIPGLADDIVQLLSYLGIKTPVHSVVGVSQGGAAALAFARSHSGLTRSIVACDTGPRTPAGNKEAWAGRVGVVYGGVSAEDVLRVSGSSQLREGVIGKGQDYAVKVGMRKLAEITVPRWFSSPSKCADGKSERKERNGWLKDMVERTDVDGFKAGAEALSDYDILQADRSGKVLFTSPISRVLLVAGSLDGAGKVGGGLRKLADDWNRLRLQDRDLARVEFVEIGESGHLPMVDKTEDFAEVLLQFLAQVKP